jgi:CheY-like chemotaxis protein
MAVVADSRLGLSEPSRRKRRMVTNFGKSMEHVRKCAVVIEPDLGLADTLHDHLLVRGFHTATFATHGAAAASATMMERVDVLLACIPASDDDREGAYLEDARKRQEGDLPIVLMVADPGFAEPSAPRHAISIVKPFTTTQLSDAMDEAGVAAK